MLWFYHVPGPEGCERWQRRLFISPMKLFIRLIELETQLRRQQGEESP
jgi:hypothetical protein